MNVNKSKLPEEPSKLPEGFIPVVQEQPEARYWIIILIFGLILHFIYSFMTGPVEVCIGRTIGTIILSMIFVFLIKKVRKTWNHFTKINITIALYLGLFMIMIEDYGKIRRGLVLFIASLLYIVLVIKDYVQRENH